MGTRKEYIMSDAEFKKLQDTHPNLHQAVQSGTLTEANHDFIAVAKQYPQHEKQ